MYTQYIEITSTILTIACLWLGIKQHVANWPIGIVITLMDLIIYHQNALYDRWVNAAMIVLFSLYGWYQWAYGSVRNDTFKKITHTSVSEWSIIALLGIVSIIALSPLLTHIGSSLPYHGAGSIFLMFLGLWMTSHKKLHSYLVWGVYNLLTIYINYTKGNYWFSIKYAIALGFSIYGYYDWRAVDRAQVQKQSVSVGADEIS